MQMRRLETVVGKPLLRRTGRGVVPTPDGELLLGYATRILALGEEASSRLSQQPMAGNVRIGLAEEIAITSLPAALGRLRRQFRDLHLHVYVDHSAAIARRWQDGELDLVVATASAVAAETVDTWAVELLWVTAIDSAPDPAQPLDIVAYDEPCIWRRRMLDALTDTGRAYRVTVTSQSIAAIRSAVENGLGVALMTSECVDPARMRIVSTNDGVPEALSVRYGLYTHRKPTEITEIVRRALLETVQAP